MKVDDKIRELLEKAKGNISKAQLNKEKFDSLSLALQKINHAIFLLPKPCETKKRGGCWPEQQLNKPPAGEIEEQLIKDLRYIADTLKTELGWGGFASILKKGAGHLTAQAKREKAIHKALEPIAEWYGGGTEDNRSDLEILTDAIADLQKDRVEVLAQAKQIKELPASGCDGYYCIGEEEWQENKQLQAQIEQLEEQNRWIPVSERLPENTDDVWMCSTKVKTLRKAGSGFYSECCKKWIWFDRSGDKPTHWKPIILPKP